MTEKEILKEACDKLTAKGLEADVKYLTSMYIVNEDGEIFPLYYAVADYINDNESYEDWDELLYYLDSIGEEIIDERERKIEKTKKDTKENGKMKIDGSTPIGLKQDYRITTTGCGSRRKINNKISFFHSV